MLLQSSRSSPPSPIPPPLVLVCCELAADFQLEKGRDFYLDSLVSLTQNWTKEARSPLAQHPLGIDFKDYELAFFKERKVGECLNLRQSFPIARGVLTLIFIFFLAFFPEHT